MSSLELAIRKALERAGPGADAAQRARIYQSARTALENGLRQQKISDPAVIADQRRQLEAAVHAIERDARLDFMEYEARQRAAREEAEREERRRLDAELEEETRLQAEQAREQAERDAELRRRRSEIDRERAAREAEYEAAQRALRERIAAREQAAREQALRERERLEQEARREDDARRQAEEAAERERQARDLAERERADREQAERDMAEREKAAREEAERRAALEAHTRAEAAARAEEAAKAQAAARAEAAARAQAEAAAKAEAAARAEAAAEAARLRAAEEESRFTLDDADAVQGSEPVLAQDQARFEEAPSVDIAARRDESLHDGFLLDEPPTEAAAPGVEHDRPGNREPVFDIVPEVDTREERLAPTFDIDTPEHRGDEEPAPAPAARELRAVRPRKRSRWKARAFALVTLGAFVAAGWWWVETTGMLLPASVRGGGVPNPPPQVADEDFDGAKQLKSLSRQGGYGDEWTTLYQPGKSTAVTPGAAATTKVEQSGSGPYLSITSGAEGVDGSVAIELPQSVIASLQGKTSNISLMLEGGDKPVQVTVECEFGGLGNCGRHRFLLSQNKNDYLFDVTVKGNGAPDGPGRLLINANAGGEANSAKLFSIHVLPGG